MRSSAAGGARWRRSPGARYKIHLPALPFFLCFPSCPGVAVGSCCMTRTVLQLQRKNTVAAGRRYSLTEMGRYHQQVAAVTDNHPIHELDSRGRPDRLAGEACRSRSRTRSTSSPAYGEFFRIADLKLTLVVGCGEASSIG
jgi:hypothetical protein